MMIRALLPAALLGLLALAGCQQANEPATIAGPATVIDGDSLRIRGENIRLHAIDSPETRQSCTIEGHAWPCGRNATRALREFIMGARVQCDPRDIDRYGRVVAVCSARGVDLNAWMVRNGWAVAYRQYGRDYVPLEAAAQADRAGIWAGEFEMPWDWRRAQRR